MKASEIVRRAEQIADLVNSDYISQNENEQLLNENYKNIYQKIINEGDRYFIKEFDLTKAKPFKENNVQSFYFDLPDDFYQLNLITLGSQQIFRQVSTQPIGTRCYDLKNNKLILHALQTTENLKIEYYPLPQKIILAEKEKEVYQYLKDDKTVYRDVSEIKAIGRRGQIAFIDSDYSTNKNLYVSYGEGKPIVKLNEPPTGYYLFSDNLLCIISDDGKLNVYNEQELFTNQDLKGCFFADGFLFFISPNNDLFVVVDNSDLVTEVQNVDMTDNTDLITFLNDDNNYSVAVADKNIFTNDIKSIKFYKTTSNNIIKCFDNSNNEITEIFKTPVNATSVTLANNNIYCFDSVIKSIFQNGKLELNDITLINEDNRLNEQPVLITKENDKIIKRSVETDLIYPKNIFFDYIAYNMAISYNLKQQKDTLALSEKVSNIEEQFFDSLTRDSFQPLRMPNVYNDSGISRGY